MKDSVRRTKELKSPITLITPNLDELFKILESN